MAEKEAGDAVGSSLDHFAQAEEIAVLLKQLPAGEKQIVGEL